MNNPGYALSPDTSAVAIATRSKAISARDLGHTNPSTTQRYAHLADDPLREAAEIMGRKLAAPLG